MIQLTNCHKQPLVVRDGEARHEIAPGATIEVSGGDWSEHLFVKAGWLQVVNLEAAGQESDTESSTPVTVEDITGDDGVFTVRASDGVEFSPVRNQVRADGTLTDGGLKAYEAAKAKQAES